MTFLPMDVSCTLFVAPFASSSPEAVATGASNADCSTHAGAGKGVGAEEDCRHEEPTLTFLRSLYHSLRTRVVGQAVKLQHMRLKTRECT